MKKLTKAEIKRLLKYIKDHGGRQTVSEKFGINSATMDRSITRQTGPSRLLRNKLIEEGIVGD